MAPDMTADSRRRNSIAWLGFALAWIAALLNIVFFVNAAAPVQRLAPWVIFAVAGLALIALVIALKRAFGESAVYRGKVLTVVLAVIALLPLFIATYGNAHARDVPASTGAPHVGQAVPEFALADTSGKMTSLADLLAPPPNGGAAPKSVLLVFYRGYW